jgi:hypothetical protein
MSLAGFAFGVSAARQPAQPARPGAELTVVSNRDNAAPTPVAWTPSDACPLEDCSAPEPHPKTVKSKAQPTPRPPGYGDDPPPTATPRPSWAGDHAWQGSGFVAHAFGSPADGTPYTNSAAAFERSYANGFRTFETDMVRLGDGNVLLAHDNFEQRYGLPDHTRFDHVSIDVMRGRLLDGRYPALFGDDFIAIVRDHPDAFFILDTKVAHLEIAAWLVERMTPTELDRLRPHVHSQEQIDALRRMYDWKGFVIASYGWTQDAAVIERTAAQLASRNHIDTVMVRDEYYSDGMRDRLREAGVRFLYLHSFTAPEEIEHWRSKGLGVYSNGWIGS